MGIPESQLHTWSGQGAMAGSRDTYATIKRALDGTQFAGGAFSVFLQGSYGNDTNIYSESDVDVVMSLDAIYNFDDRGLSFQNRQLRQAAWAAPTYSYDAFRSAVIAQLRYTFGNDVDDRSSNKAVKIVANGSRRSADVIIANPYRRYFDSWLGPDHTEGIRFITREGRVVINYPKQHSENCTRKHQSTENRFKPTVRIFKNMRRRLVDQRIIPSGTAPSYFIEGMLYNVPSHLFAGSHENTVERCLYWLLQTDQTQLLCANEQYHLLQENAGAVDFWSPRDCNSFLEALVGMWSRWQ